MASKTELEEKIRNLKDENRILQENFEAAVKDLRKSEDEIDRLVSAISLLDVATEIDVNFEELGDHVVLNGMRYQVERIRTGADIFDDIKKRLVGEGQTCIVIKREGV